jgi:hypothetical protein
MKNDGSAFTRCLEGVTPGAFLLKTIKEWGGEDTF